MSDSVDRVFVHALNTVKRIPRTGTARPPAAERLKLYGLYKQSMEGDVEGIMDRPIGDAPDVQAERDKWDAWYSQRGISRTEAKRHYITTLINTMHLYASQTAEARELVAELEFVWDQIKYNASSSSSSSPMQATTNSLPLPIAPDTTASKTRYGSIDDRMTRSSLPPPPYSNEDPDEDLAIYRRRSGDSRLRVLSPVSQSDEADVARSRPFGDEGLEETNPEEDDENEDEFQEARDGTSYSEGAGTDSQDHMPNNFNTIDHRTRKKRKRISTTSIPQPDDDWRRRVEQALTKMTAEVAALREQIESQGPITHHSRRRGSIWSWIKWLFWNTVRQMLWHGFIAFIILIWMRFKGDRRFERKLLTMIMNVKHHLMTLRIPRRIPNLAQLPLP